ncbi:GntR family transcriptional regulator [Sulfitobacter sp. 1A12057]|uniref:GntR family transcriptional regulator n=1 Tax=Sulfitobacter sp. 1A12057 TaxID=3368567 RepID=UPI003746DAA6
MLEHAPPSPEAQDAESLSQVVYNRLCDRLMRAELRPHQRLKVRELSREMGMSETPVREALFQLAHQGALEIKPRYYIRVRRISVSEYEDIRDIRMQLEPLAAERALPFINDDDICEMERLHAQLLAAEASGNWPGALKANFDFHFGLYYRSEMPSLVEMLERLWIRVGPILSELYPEAAPTYGGRHQHEAVLDALRSRSAYALREAIRMDLVEGGQKLRRHLKAVEVDAENQGAKP